MTAKELSEKRAKLAAELKRLHKENLAVDGDGNFTAEWTAAEKEYDALSKEIEKIERIESIGARIGRIDQDQGPRPSAGTLPGRGNVDHRPSARDFQQQSALALQAWFRANSSSELDLTDEHRAACAAVGLRPNAKQLSIRLVQDDVLAQMQRAFASASPHQAMLRAREVMNHYGAALSTQVASDGATIVAPESMMGSLEINMLAYGGILQVAETMRTAGRERLRWPTFDDTGNEGSRIGENTAVDSDDQPTMSAIYWDLYKYTSGEILVPYELLAGTPYNLANILGGMMGERIGRKANRDLTTGTGSNGPKGLMTAATSFSAASATAISWDDLENLISAVDPAYRMGASFMFHDSIRGYLKKLKDGQGRPLWQDSPNGGEPGLLKDYPWFINQNMDSTIASGKKSISFGQHSKYKVRQLDTIRIYRLTERHRENDQDAFLAFAELDGNLLDAGTAPVKYLSH